MKYAIIAAGEGSRLTLEGVKLPKPLVEVGGESLMQRLLRIFMVHEATEICVICNDLSREVEAFLKRVQEQGIDDKTVPLRYRVKTTPSSMHSFYELAELLDGDEPFVLTTVDTVFREEEFADYLGVFETCLSAGNDGLMGITSFVDDEKPLYVEVDERQNITAFLDTPANQASRRSVSEQCPNEVPGSMLYVSAGIYGLTPKALLTLRACVARGESRMRNFQRALLRDGLQLQGWVFSKVLDVDHQSDIAKAEVFLSE